MSDDTVHLLDALCFSSLVFVSFYESQHDV